MHGELHAGAWMLLGAGALLLALAWAIGVLGHVRLITNYRAHPERYPDAGGLGRWMGWTLGAGGFSLVVCAAAALTGAIGEAGLGMWVMATALALVAGALAGLARHRRMPPPAQPPPPRKR